MAVSMRDLDPAFQGAGQKVGIEIWRIENFHPVRVSPSSHGKFFTGDSYVILKTTSSKNGALRHDIHYWLGKDTSQDEAGTAAFKTVELDASLGGHAVQYREVQGHETEKFLSYFKPCIIPQQGGVASGFKHPETEEHKTRMYICKGKRVVHVKEVPFSRSSLGHDDVFILDTKTKIFQFNGSNSSIQERAKALEVVQYIKDTYHDGKCEVAAIEDGRMMADADTGEFWGLFGGFAPLPRKVVNEDDKSPEASAPKLFCFEKGQLLPVQHESLNRELLTTNNCYLLDCGSEIFVWMGRTTSLDERKSASAVTEEMLSGTDRAKTHIIRVIEGFETVMFRSKFDYWPQTSNTSVSEAGRSKVAALLLLQKFDRGPSKTASVKEEAQPFLDCTGNLQVWRMNGEEKNLLSSSEQSKFYSGDCYIFQYTYPGEDKEECLIGTWFGKQSIEKDRSSALSLATKMVESSKLRPVQARIYEGKEPVQFFSIFQSFILFKGGLSSGYKYYLKENGITDETYTEDGTALLRIQGSGPEYMQAIQVELVGSSLNSSYCYILQSGSTVFTWAGSLTSPEDQEIVERQLDMIKPNLQPKPQKEGTESQQFWDLLGGKCEHPSLKIKRDAESDPRLFSCTFLKGTLKVHEIFNFSQDDLMTEDMFILDCRSDIFIWIGQQVDSKGRMQSLSIGEKYLEQDFLMEKLSQESPLFIIMEGSEPPFFTRFFNWDPSKAVIQGNSFERRLAIVKNGVAPSLDRPRRRPPVSGGRSSTMPDKSQRSRSMSFSPDRVRVRGRSPMFQELALKFEKPNTRNLSTPPQVGRGPKIFPKAVTPDSAMLAPKSSKIMSLTSTFESAKVIQSPSPEAIKENITKIEVPKLKPQNSDSMSSRIESLTIQEDQKEGEIDDDDEGLPIFPYDRLKTTSTDPVADIDVTKRETYLSSEEFREKFGMTKDAFYKLAKWRQNKLKEALLLF